MFKLHLYGLLLVFILSVGILISGCSQAVATEPAGEESAEPVPTPRAMSPSLVATTPNPTQRMGATQDAEKQEFFDELYGDQEPPSEREMETPYVTRHERMSPTPRTPRPTSTVAVGITQDCWESYPHVLIPRNCSTDLVDDMYVTVFAGSVKNMPQQGLVIVVTTSTNGRPGTPSEFYRTPEQRGWIEIERVDASIVYLRAEDGTSLTFNTHTREWGAVVRTPTPQL